MSVIKRATIVASLTAFLLTILKFIVAFITGSVVVLASAIDSILDMTISLFNLYAVRASEKDQDNLYNYGRGKIEGFASITEGVIITASGVFIIYQGVLNIISNKPVQEFGLAFGVMIFSSLVTLFLVLYLNKVAKTTNSLVIKSDALHYKTDLFTNMGIIFSLIVIYLTEIHAIDGIVSVIIAFYIIKEAISIIFEGADMLMDRALDDETQAKIKTILENIEISDYHFLRTRRSGNVNIVDVHLVFDKDILLYDAHEISDEFEAKVAAIDNKSKWIITTHLDPYDDSKSVKEHH